MCILILFQTILCIYILLVVVVVDTCCMLLQCTLEEAITCLHIINEDIPCGILGRHRKILNSLMCKWFNCSSSLFYYPFVFLFIRILVWRDKQFPCAWWNLKCFVNIFRWCLKANEKDFPKKSFFMLIFTRCNAQEPLKKMWYCMSVIKCKKWGS